MNKHHEVAVIGTGLIGQAWALVFARGNCGVRLWDGNAQALDHAHGQIRKLAIELESSGLVPDAGELAKCIRVCPDLEEALAGVDYVQENLPERLSTKIEIFHKLDQLAPQRAVLASSTSSIPASAFTRDLDGRARCLVAHPVNPPYLIPLVEVCGTPWTDSASTDACLALMEDIGQKPVHVRRELEGFIMNRLQGALLREAFRLVERGFIDVEGLDITVREGLGLRWSFMGPFETIDLNAPEGLADYCRRYGGLFQSIAQEQASVDEWSAALIDSIDSERRSHLSAEELPERRIWRDRRLMALAKHKRAETSAEKEDPR